MSSYPCSWPSSRSQQGWVEDRDLARGAGELHGPVPVQGEGCGRGPVQARLHLQPRGLLHDDGPGRMMWFIFAE